MRSKGGVVSVTVLPQVMACESVAIVAEPSRNASHVVQDHRRSSYRQKRDGCSLKALSTSDQFEVG